jgi:16S rRNA pseudouridine516 synthase
MKQLRLDKYLADMNVETRSRLKKLIRAGQVSVNGRPERRPEAKVTPGQDRVALQDREIPYREQEYIMLNKPAGVVSAVTDPRERTVMDLLPAIRRTDLFPVGRLDKDTEGLLLITGDGELSHRLLSPKRHVEKVYYAEVDGRITEEDREAFRNGLDIGDETPALPARLMVLEAGEVSRVQVTVTEGRFHQVKRMFAARGRQVLYLKRLSMGPLELDETLEKGEWRRLTPEELSALKAEESE